MKLDQQLSTFIWNNKPARLRGSVLQFPKSEGGLALPNLRQYYWACNITKLLHWLNYDCSIRCPLRVHIKVSSSKSSLSSIICSQLPIASPKVSNNHVDTIKIWLLFRKHYGLHRASILAPILNNHLSSPSSCDPAFRTWFPTSLISLNDLYDGGLFSSFSSLSAKCNLPNSHLYIHHLYVLNMACCRVNSYTKCFTPMINLLRYSPTEALLATDANKPPRTMYICSGHALD